MLPRDGADPDHRHGHQRRRRAPGPAINLYPFISSDADHHHGGAGRAPRRPTPTEPVGERITDPGPYDTIDELRPGRDHAVLPPVPRRCCIPATSPGRLLVRRPRPRRERRRPRRPVADGRARTFLPGARRHRAGRSTPRSWSAAAPPGLVRRRRHARRTPSGGPDALARRPAARARSTSARAAGDRPLTWLVDPAVLDAVGRLAAGNPARSLDPDRRRPAGGGPRRRAHVRRAPSDPPPSRAPARRRPSDAEPPRTPSRGAAAAASDWLTGCTRRSGHEVLGAAVRRPRRRRAAATPRARRLRPAPGSATGAELARLGLPVTPAGPAPAGGYLSAARRSPTGRRRHRSCITRPRRSAVAAPPSRRDAARPHGRGDLAPTRPTGGPAPTTRTPARRAPADRSSEAALRLLDAGPAAAGGAAARRPGHPTSTRRLLRRARPGLARPRPGRPRSPPATGAPVDATGSTTRGARASAELERRRLRRRHRPRPAPATLLQAAHPQRPGRRHGPRRGADDARPTPTAVAPRPPARPPTRSRRWIDDRAGPGRGRGARRAVTLSSDTGRFSATVINGLDQPVTVRRRGPVRPARRAHRARHGVELGPAAAQRVLLKAPPTSPASTRSRCSVTDTDGAPLGVDRRAADPRPPRSAT